MTANKIKFRVYNSPELKLLEIDFQSILAASNPVITNPPMEWGTEKKEFPWDTEKKEFPWDTSEN